MSQDTNVNTTPTAPDELRARVRDHYAEAARVAQSGDATHTSGCCGASAGASCGCGGSAGGSCGYGSGSAHGSGDAAIFGAALYEATERGELPETAVLASLGCGNPTAVAELREGERVLDLGSGGGIDVLLSARRVGPTGKAYGLDMTEEMLALARRNAAEAGATNVEFLKGYIEEIPLPAESVDVVISNCVINLSADKSRVFAEMHRVLGSGGRVGVSDVVASDDLTPEERAERGSLVGCIAGALSFQEYEAGLRAAGFDDVEITTTHDVAPGMFSAIVRARRPATAPGERPAPAASEHRTALRVVQGAACC